MAARLRPVVWAHSAYAALDEVVAYIAQDSRQAALRVLEQALNAAADLGTMSERGRVVPELDDAAIREVFIYRRRRAEQRVVCRGKQEGEREVRLRETADGSLVLASLRWTPAFACGDSLAS